MLQIQDPSPLWSLSTDTPRWEILTDQEQMERDKQIRKLGKHVFQSL